MTRRAKNILFVMYDQLRFDYLSCTGHPFLQTPHFDRLAAQGVRFDRTYVQSPICGSSRMSFYTGRYVHSHGAQMNGYPLKVGEQTLGDHLRKEGMSCHLIGKTHMRADVDGMERLGITHDSIIGARLSECGFDIWVRDDGLWAEGPDGFYDENRSPYNEYLKSKGYVAENPWNVFANAGIDADGNIASGWFTKHAEKPANIREEDSETPWLTSEAIKFIDAQAEAPWCAHLSYIKPHWPYIVPAPYHDMYGPNQIQPANRSQHEKTNAQPVFDAYMNNAIGQLFQRDEVRQKVIPAYMGLIKQCDDQLGRLLDHLETTGRMQDTMIILTSDHGDYLGDHWMGEKSLFHDCSVRVPLIIYDPSTEADATRGTTCDALIESIDVTATCIQAAAGEFPDHIVEGRPLQPFLYGAAPDDWRTYAISEFDYATTGMAQDLGVSPRDARLFMVVTRRWKMMHAEGGFRPMLFDLENDPQEQIDLGADPDYEPIRDQLYQHLAEWARRMSQRTTISDARVIASRGKSDGKGILLHLYDGSEVPDSLTEKLRGKAPTDYTN